MSDIQEQLAALRQRIARIDRKYADNPPQPEPDPDKPARYHPDDWMPGEEVETVAGKHFETERLWEKFKRHGSMDVGSLCELPADLLRVISNEEVLEVPPTEWAFLDTETTGLAGGSGTYAFLIGVGRITPEGFRVRQFFMREYGEEPSLLTALEDHLSQFRVLVTYNGKAYDQPLLETRYRLSRKKPPFTRMAHVDLLFGARRLWKLRFDSCRLVELENQILGVEREGDLPGAMIPYVYFEYMRKREAFRVMPIFHHNANDILTLACLTGIVPWAFQSPETAPLSHAAEMIGLARWLRQAGQEEQALALFRRALEHPSTSYKGSRRPLAEEVLFRTMWDVALLERKLGRAEACLSLFSELAGCANPFRAKACIELAKYYEHSEKNHAMALEMTRAALGLEDSTELRHREQRLAKKLASPRSRRLL
jgi:uncharacterized protein YprB with RNaseH-like and TPR domain